MIFRLLIKSPYLFVENCKISQDRVPEPLSLYHCAPVFDVIIWIFFHLYCNTCSFSHVETLDFSNLLPSGIFTKFSAFYRQVRPWPNDSIFHSIFSSTFDLKVERLLSVVEHMWPNGSIFRSTFLSTFHLLMFPQLMSAKNIYHHKYLTA